MNDEQLIRLYQKVSKHSNYQILPQQIKRLLPQDSISVISRNEKERLDYICSKLDVTGFKVADIGGNTGYFSFELLEKGADKVYYYEGNYEHFQFVSYAAKHLNLDSRLITNNSYIDFKSLDIPNFDCILLLNVLHHVGDDYGDKDLNKEDVQESILDAIKLLAFKTKFLVLQIGFNWKGSPKLPIFDNGLKSEIVSLISLVIDFYEVISVGVAVKDGVSIRYENLSDMNNQRDESLGEFLNRPLFILRSKKF